MMECRRLASFLFLAVLLISGSANVVHPTITLTPVALSQYRDSPLKVTVPYIAQLICNSTDVEVRNVEDTTQYEECRAPVSGNVQVGHCGNDEIYLVIHTTGVSGQINYQVGHTYYYVVYGGNGETNFCDEGYKFKIEIVDPESLITSSSIIPDMTSSSYLTPLSSTISYSSTSSTLSTITPTPTTSTARPTRPTTSSTAKPNVDDKPTSTAVRTTLLITTEPTGTARPAGITSDGVSIRGSSVLLYSTLLLLALWIPLLRTLL